MRGPTCAEGSVLNGGADERQNMTVAALWNATLQT